MFGGSESIISVISNYSDIYIDNNSTNNVVGGIFGNITRVNSVSSTDNYGYIYDNGTSNIVGSLFGQSSCEDIYESGIEELNIHSHTDQQCAGQLDRYFARIFNNYSGFENHYFTELGYCVWCGTTCNHEWSSETIILPPGYCTDSFKDQNHLCMHCLVAGMHDWDGYGMCSSCNYECEHYSRSDFWQDGVCMNCGAQCQHVFNGTTGGQCMNCNYICPHMNTMDNGDGGMLCMDCGMVIY